MTLAIENIQQAKQRGFFIFQTRDWDIDLLEKLRLFIDQKFGIRIPDWLKIERKSIKHIFDNHAYDTELGWWTSITLESFLKIPEILFSYENIEDITFTEDLKTHLRIHLKKDYNSDTYNLVLEILQDNPSPNQLWMITLYINDVVGEINYLQAKQRWEVKKKRAIANNEYWDRYAEI